MAKILTEENISATLKTELLDYYLANSPNSNTKVERPKIENVYKMSEILNRRKEKTTKLLSLSDLNREMNQLKEEVKLLMSHFAQPEEEEDEEDISQFILPQQNEQSHIKETPETSGVTKTDTDFLNIL